MSTVACIVLILSAWELMKSINSCWVADCNGAEVTCRSTLCERKRHPLKGRTMTSASSAR